MWPLRAGNWNTRKRSSTLLFSGFELLGQARFHSVRAIAGDDVRFSALVDALVEVREELFRLGFAGSQQFLVLLNGQLKSGLALGVNGKVLFVLAEGLFG